MLYNDFTSIIFGLQGLIIKEVEKTNSKTIIYAEMERKEHHFISCGTETKTVHDYRTQEIKDISSFGNNIVIILKVYPVRPMMCRLNFSKTLPKVSPVKILTAISQALSSTGVKYILSIYCMLFQNPTEELTLIRNELYRLMHLPEPPTAIFCINDELAIKVQKQAISLGYKIPNDLSVVGFDNLDNYSNSTIPLTTCAQDFKKIGNHSI